LIVKAVESSEASVTGPCVSTGDERGRGRRRTNTDGRGRRHTAKLGNFTSLVRPPTTTTQQHDAFIQHVINGCAAERIPVRAQPHFIGAHIGLVCTIYQNETGGGSITTTKERNDHSEPQQIIGHAGGFGEEPLPPAKASIATPETSGAPSNPNTTTPAPRCLQA
jgi:hypothetical protein